MEISQYMFEKECEEIAQDIIDECEDSEEHYDRAHEWADGHEWVIYTYKAGLICQLPNANDGEQWLEDCYGKPFDGCETYSDVTTRLAYATLLVGIQNALSELEEIA